MIALAPFLVAPRVRRAVYVSVWQLPPAHSQMGDSRTHLRVMGDGGAMLAQIRQQLAALNPQIPTGGWTLYGWTYGKPRLSHNEKLKIGSVCILPKNCARTSQTKPIVGQPQLSSPSYNIGSFPKG